MSAVTTLSIKDLKKWSEILLNLSVEDEQLVPTINAIHALYKDITSVSGFDNQMSRLAAVPTSTGVALGLNHAAQCLLDYKRTLKFLKGIVAAIRSKLHSNDYKRVNVFYAGCGPYAPFVNLVAPLFSEDEIRFTVLDINKESLSLANKLVVELGHEKYVEEYILADAVNYKVPNAEKYDIVFSETLDALLYREAYVPIYWNLKSQFSKEIIFIPDTVQVHASFYDKIQVGEVVDEPRKFELIFDVVENLNSVLDKKFIPDFFPTRIIPIESEKKFKSMILDTTVNIFQNIKLVRSESSLTLPVQFELEEDAYPRCLEFTYFLTPQIELKYTVL